jgi:putrescine aminotransferase
MGNILKQNLNELASDYPDILEEVLGRGLLLGLKFTTPDKVANFMQSCVKSGLLLTPCLTTPSVVRISPAATMTSQEINKGLDILSLACKEVIKN